MTQPAFCLLARHGARDPVAFGAAGTRTAAQLRADVASLARTLPDATESSHIAVICGDRYLFAVALLAAWQKGHAVALPPNGRPETVATVRNRPEVALLLHDTDADTGVDLRARLGSGEDGPALAPLDPGRVLATVFTSGSTGTVTPCVKTARQLLGEVRTLQTTFAIRPGQCFVATVPPHHIYGLLFSVLLPLQCGAAFLRDTPLHAESIAARIAEHGASVLVSVPAHLIAFGVLQPGQLSSIERVFSSTAPLPDATAAAVRERHGLAVTEVFGSSETGGIAFRQRNGSDLWQPLQGVTVTADDAGHLLVDSPHLEPDAPRPLRTADCIRMDGARFEHLGRADGVVKTGGKRIALAHLESCLLGLPGVRDAAVMAAPSAQGARGADVLAAVVAPGWTAARLREALLAWFEPSELPRRIVLLPTLQREDNGKLPRARMWSALAAQRAPSTQVEVLGHQVAGDGAHEHVFQLRVPEDLLYFQGHFRAMPTLPGVAELRTLVLPRVADVRPDWTFLRRVARLKFRRIIGPGDVLDLRLVFATNSSHVDFEIARAGDGCASGRMAFEVSAP